VLDPNVVKGPWKSEEDGRLLQLVAEIGPKWSRIAAAMNGRNGKQCRERWVNHLDPDISKEPWSKAEEDALIAAHEKMGSKWSEMTKLLKGRTHNAIKNHWHSMQSSKKRAAAAAAGGAGVGGKVKKSKKKRAAAAAAGGAGVGGKVKKSKK
jgi:myb proto-oncogene protein